LNGESRPHWGGRALPSERLVIARFGTTHDLRMAMVDICRLTADTIAALHAPAGATPRTIQPR